MAGVTNRGKKVIQNTYFAADATDEPTAFKLALVTSATAPGPDTNVMADLTEVASGNGYTTGGEAVPRSAVGFDSIVEDDTLDQARIQIKDVVWTASGGPIPASGDPPRYAVLLDDAVTPNVVAFFDLVEDRTVSSGQTLTIQDSQINFNES